MHTKYLANQRNTVQVRKIKNWNVKLQMAWYGHRLTSKQVLWFRPSIIFQKKREDEKKEENKTLLAQYFHFRYLISYKGLGINVCPCSSRKVLNSLQFSMYWRKKCLP